MQIRAPIAVNTIIVYRWLNQSAVFLCPKGELTMLNIELQHFGGRGAASSTAHTIHRVMVTLSKKKVLWKKHTLGARARSKQAMPNSKVI